jgi:hypothetical protein
MACSPKNKPIETNSLAQLVAEFLEQDGCCPRDEVKIFQGLKIDDAISKAAQAKDKTGNFFNHQWNLFNHPEVPQQAEKILLSFAAKIEACKNFDSLHELIKSELQIPFAGEMFWYDTAFRIGISMSVYPQKLYLHAGTRKGAIALGVYEKGEEVLEVSELVKKYPEFAKMKPHQIEDFLCIKKDMLHKFKRA